MIKVMIVDDHEMVRLGLCTYLLTEEGINVVAEANGGVKAIALANIHQPDVILMDLLMEEGSGIDATREIMQYHPQTKIIILTSFLDDQQVFPAIEAGAFSYLLKTSSAQEVVTSIHKAYSGISVIDSEVTSKMMSNIRNDTKQDQPLHYQLTKRELEVLCCIGEGLNNKAIGERLFIGIKTVKTHVSNILGKLQVSDRTQAAIYASKHQLV